MATANNNTPISTQTKVVKFKIDGELKNKIEETANNAGEKGYLMSSSFVLDDSLVCVFQRTR